MYWIAKREPFQLLYVFGHCRTHQKRLEQLREVSDIENLLNIFIMSIRQDKIGFIDDKRLEI